MKNCQEYQEAIMDNFDQEFLLSEDVVEHMETCSSCLAFYEDLKALNEKMTMPSAPIEIDQDLIRRAVSEGTKIRDRREALKGNMAFIMTALILFTIAALVVGLGYGMALVALQILIVFVSPIIVPVTIVRQMKGARQ